MVSRSQPVTNSRTVAATAPKTKTRTGSFSTGSPAITIVRAPKP